MFHAALLRQYKETEVYGANFPELPPELVEGDEVYDIENIIRHWKGAEGIYISSNGRGIP